MAIVSKSRGKRARVQWPRRVPALLLGVAILLMAASIPVSISAKDHTVATPLDENQRILHLLDRFTFGPAPGEMDQVRALGMDKWFEQQLHPASIRDDLADTMTAQFRTLKMSTKEIAANYPTPRMVRQIADGKAGMPGFGFGADSDKRALYQSAVDRYRERQAEKQANRNEDAVSQKDHKVSRTSSDDRQAGHAEVDTFLAESPEERYKMALALPDGERKAMFRTLKPDERQQVFADFTPKQREEMIALTANPAAVVTTELLQAKLLRETYSNRQLEEVMTDFWLNHFNVFINKGQERYLLTAYERDVIRPHALGKFKDLLIATAHSPAMLFYLDNSESIGPDSEFAQNGGHQPRAEKHVRRRPQAPMPRQARASAKRKLTGLNENYAREIMELHTLGVDGGYTQQDVTSLAKVLTGWTITPPQTGNFDFEFRSEWHQPGEKTVLGKRFKDHGEKEGVKALDMLARSPATARFISRKLAQRFVSDEPPPALVERMAKTFLHSDGDISQVLRTLYKSPEFWSQAAYRAKVKTPLEFVVSGLRATGADVANAQPLAQQLNKMGMPLYGMQPPTGYPMTADAWVNSAALLARFNFALALASGKIQGVSIDPKALALEPKRAEDQDPLATLEARLFNSQLSAQTHAAIEKELADASFASRAASGGNDAVAKSSLNDGEALATAAQFSSTKNLPVGRESLAIGLILGSPVFQRR